MLRQTNINIINTFTSEQFSTLLSHQVNGPKAVIAFCRQQLKASNNNNDHGEININYLFSLIHTLQLHSRIEITADDFFDKQLPETRPEQIAKLLRQLLALDPTHAEALTTLGVMIAGNKISAAPADFLETAPETVVEQAATLYRRANSLSSKLNLAIAFFNGAKALPTDFPENLRYLVNHSSTEQSAGLCRYILSQKSFDTTALGSLAFLIMEQNVAAEASDFSFSPHGMPATKEEQAALLLRHELQFSDGPDSLFLLTRWIIEKRINPIAEDFSINKIDPSREEIIAILLRRVLDKNPAHEKALFELSRLLASKKVVRSFQDLINFHRQGISGDAQHSPIKYFYKYAMQHKQDNPDTYFEVANLLLLNINSPELFKMDLGVDDPDKQTAKNFYEWCANLYRRHLALKPNHTEAAERLLDLLSIVHSNIPAQTRDFSDGVLPEKKPQQIAKFCRELLTKDKTSSFALLILSDVFIYKNEYNNEIIPEETDFSKLGIDMPSAAIKRKVLFTVKALNAQHEKPITLPLISFSYRALITTALDFLINALTNNRIVITEKLLGQELPKERTEQIAVLKEMGGIESNKRASKITTASYFAHLHHQNNNNTTETSNTNNNIETQCGVLLKKYRILIEQQSNLRKKINDLNLHDNQTIQISLQTIERLFLEIHPNILVIAAILKKNPAQIDNTPERIQKISNELENKNAAIEQQFDNINKMITKTTEQQSQFLPTKRLLPENSTSSQGFNIFAAQNSDSVKKQKTDLNKNGDNDVTFKGKRKQEPLENLAYVANLSYVKKEKEEEEEKKRENKSPFP